MSLQFVGRLQYTEGNTSHFAEWYRWRLVGGFHASQQDGNLRIDATQFAVSGLLHFLDADLPRSKAGPGASGIANTARPQVD